METHAKITMLGTGNAHCTRCYNTCFTLQDADGGILLVDAGGGNGILVQMERAGLRPVCFKLEATDREAGPFLGRD